MDGLSRPLGSCHWRWKNTSDLMTELQHDLIPAKHPHGAPFFAWKGTADEKHWHEFSENTLQNHRCTLQSVATSTPRCIRSFCAEIQKDSRCRVKMFCSIFCSITELSAAASLPARSRGMDATEPKLLNVLWHLMNREGANSQTDTA